MTHRCAICLQPTPARPRGSAAECRSCGARAGSAAYSLDERPDGFAQSRIDEIKAMMLAVGRKG